MPRSIATKDGIQLNNIPDGISDDEIKARIADIREGNVKFDAETMVKNIPGSALQFAKDITYPVLHPQETLESLQTIGSGAAQMVAGELNRGEGAPTYANPQAVTDTKAVWEAMVGRYGGMNQLKKTAMEDPVGMLTDLSSVMTGGASLVPKVGKLAGMTEKVASLGKAIDPINLAKNVAQTTVGKPIASMISNNGLREMYLESVKFGTTIPRKTREKMADVALKEKIMPTYKGLEKLANLRTRLGGELSDLIQKATDSGTTISKQQILTRARVAMNRLDPSSQVGYAKVKNQYKKVISEMEGQWADLDILTPTQVQEFKRSLDLSINHAAAQKMFGGKYKEGAEAAQMEMRTASKNLLESIDPEIGVINKRLGGLIDLEEKGLARSASRIEQNNPVNIQAPLMSGAGGAMAGPVGAAVGTGVAVSQMPKPRAMAAIKFKTLQDSPISEIFFNNQGVLTPIGRVMVQQGRLTQETQQ